MRIFFYIITFGVFVCLGLFLTFGHKDANIDISSRISAFAVTTSRLQTKESRGTVFKNRSSQYIAAKEKHFPPHLQTNIINAANKEQLQSLYDEVYNYLLRSNDKTALSFIEKIYSQLETNNWLKKSDIRSMHRLYLMFRVFQKADGLSLKYPDQNLPPAPKAITLEHQPHIQSPNIRPVIKGNINDNSFELSEMDFSSYTGVVVVAHPKCHFF